MYADWMHLLHLLPNTGSELFHIAGGTTGSYRCGWGMTVATVVAASTGSSTAAIVSVSLKVQNTDSPEGYFFINISTGSSKCWWWRSPAVGSTLSHLVSVTMTVPLLLETGTGQVRWTDPLRWGLVGMNTETIRSDKHFHASFIPL